MGMYTEIYVNVDFKKDTPPHLIDILKGICQQDNEDGPEAPLSFADQAAKASHEAAKERMIKKYGHLFHSGSYYTPNTQVAKMSYDDISNQWSLLGKGDIKNYENQINEFFIVIMPWIDAQPQFFIGYSRAEDDKLPHLFFKDGL